MKFFNQETNIEKLNMQRSKKMKSVKKISVFSMILAGLMVLGIDFCGSGRGNVIGYQYQQYGNYQLRGRHGPPDRHRKFPGRQLHTWRRCRRADHLCG